MITLKQSSNVNIPQKKSVILAQCVLPAVEISIRHTVFSFLTPILHKCTNEFYSLLQKKHIYITWERKKKFKRCFKPRSHFKCSSLLGKAESSGGVLFVVLSHAAEQKSWLSRHIYTADCWNIPAEFGQTLREEFRQWKTNPFLTMTAILWWTDSHQHLLCQRFDQWFFWIRF